MPNATIRLGIVGCGGIARSRHIPGLTLLQRAGLDGFTVAALCDSVEENLTASAALVRREQGNAPELFHDWEDFIARAPVDAVDICLPHGLHHVVGIAALEAGLDVIVEKPYTVSVKTGQQLVQAAELTGKVLATAVPHRRMPGERAVHWAINEAQLIGQPRHFFANYTQWRPTAATAANEPRMVWRRDRVMGGGGPVIDSGFHFLDTARYFYGEAEQVFAELRGVDGDVLRGKQLLEMREASAVITLTFTNGVVGTWCWSFTVPGKETRNCVIYGSEGSIEDTGYSHRFVVFHPFMNGGEYRGKDGTYLSMEELQARMRQELGPERLQQYFPNGVTDHFAIELWDFLEAIRRGRPPEVDGRGGLATTALVEAIYESAYAGTSVKIADILSGAADYGWQREIDDYWAQHPAPQIRRLV